MKFPYTVPSTQYENLEDSFVSIDAGIPLQLQRSFDIFPEKIILNATLNKSYQVLKNIGKLILKKDKKELKEDKDELKEDKDELKEEDSEKKISLDRYKDRKILKSISIEPILEGSYVVINEKIIPIHESLFRPILGKTNLYNQEFICLNENNHFLQKNVQNIYPLGGNDHASLEKIYQIFFSVRIAEDETFFFEYPSNIIKEKTLENGYEEEKMISLAEIIQRGYISLLVALEDETHSYTSFSYNNYEKDFFTIHFIRKEKP